MKKYNTKTFILKASQIHSDKYDYSKVEYLNMKTPVIIICRKHTEFPQTPEKHLKGRGCKVCGGSTRHTKEEFIQVAQLIHKNKYIYDQVNYKNNKTEVQIICPIHGPFFQTPAKHLLRKHGCKHCNGKTFHTTDSFISESMKVFGERFDYSKSVFINGETPVTILCREHGEFTQLPTLHLKGAIGCRKCNGREIAKDALISRFKAIHGEVYDYSRIEFKNKKEKVQIICRLHGPFSQRINKHLTGQGCPACNKSLGEQTIANIMMHNKIPVIQQHCFEDCIYERFLRFDFYVPKFNLLIEFHGAQHYYPTKRFGGIKGFENVISRDAEKLRYTSERNIDILVIRYDDDIFMSLRNKFLSYEQDIGNIYVGNFQDKLTKWAKNFNKQQGGKVLPTIIHNKKLKVMSMNKKEFIQKALSIHKGKYSYEAIRYHGVDNHIQIRCTNHGYFPQTPYKHLQGQGCPQCATNHKVSFSEFLNRAIAAHGDKYDYSQAKFVNMATEITIICKKHGEFSQTPAIHLRPNGCKKCSGVAKLTNEEFIEKARKVHGNKYDYSKTVYLGGEKDVTIICPAHGEFTQNAYRHGIGRGCKQCNGGKEVIQRINC